jgi:hypothetical protein
LPGLVGFVGYALYPRVMPSLAVTEALEGWLGCEPMTTARIAGHGDAMMLIAGIVLSAVCDFYAAARGGATKSEARDTVGRGRCDRRFGFLSSVVKKSRRT